MTSYGSPQRQQRQPYSAPPPRRRLPRLPDRPPTLREIGRLILVLPGRVARFILTLPVRLVRGLIRLPRTLWQGWQAGAAALYRLRQTTARLPELYRWLMRVAPPGRIRRGLYTHFHPLRPWHGLRSLLTRLRGRGIWTRRAGLEVVPKALRWARRYRRHRGRFRDIEALRSIVYAKEDLYPTPYGDLTIGFLARQNSVPRRWGALLHGLSFHSQAQRVVELGAGFGISSLYLAQALLDVYPVRTCMLITIEQETRFARITADHFYQLGYDDFAEVMQGRFADRLSDALDRTAPVNLAFLDGHQDGNEVLRDFSQVKAQSRTGTIIVLTDIHTSPSMARAWRTIKDMPRIAATVDLWRWGIVIVGSGPPLHLCARL